MKAQRQTLEEISTLPQNIIEKILSLLPIQDALRTSILSRKWRHYWTSMPNIVFVDKLFKVSNDTTQFKKYKFANAIFHVLLLHSGPILEFNLSIDELEMVSEIDQIVLHLSRNNNVKKFVFKISTACYKLPSSFFSMTGLEELRLINCEVEPPLMFNGFCMLKTMAFMNVKIDVKRLLNFLSKCPLLNRIWLCGYQGLTGGSKFAFTKFLKYMPLINTLVLSNYYIKHFVAGGMPKKLPKSLVHLKLLNLDVCFMNQDELSFALCLMRSSPNLKTITLRIWDNKELHIQQTLMNFCDLEEYSDFSLDNLQKLRITLFSNSTLQMEFLKLIMAKSPVLRVAEIELHANVSVDEEVKMLRALIRHPFPRASSAAKLIIKR